MGTHSEKAAAIGGPIQAADPTGIEGTHRYAAVTASVTIPLPAEPANPQKRSTLGGRFLLVEPVNCLVQFSQVKFGETPVPLVLNQLAAFGTGNKAAGKTVRDGQLREFVLDPRTVSIVYVCDNTAGFVEFQVSDHLGRP